MKYHLRRPKHVFEDRGITDLATKALSYIPIELNNLLFRLRHGTGMRVMSEDWGTLILLDACRYDIFFEQAPLTAA